VYYENAARIFKIGNRRIEGEPLTHENAQELASTLNGGTGGS
jgi:hypothetical protein